MTELKRHLEDLNPLPLPWAIERRRYSHCDHCQALFRYDDLQAYGRRQDVAGAILCRDCVPGWALERRLAVPGMQELYMRLACEPDRKRTILSYVTGRVR